MAYASFADIARGPDDLPGVQELGLPEAIEAALLIPARPRNRRPCRRLVTSDKIIYPSD